MNTTAKEIKPLSAGEMAGIAATLDQALSASQQFVATKCYEPHPSGAGRDHVFIISNQLVLNVEELETLVNQALSDFPGLTKVMIAIRNDFASGGSNSHWGIEFPGTDRIPPTYKKLEHSPR